jgi:uncharacterized membrane protein
VNHRPKWGSRAPLILLAALILLNFIYFGLYAARRHTAFETGAYDLGVVSQPLWNYLQGRDFAGSIQDDNGPLRWANHVEPILFLVLPLYRLWPDPRLLLWLQVAGLSLAGLPLYGLVVRRLGSGWAALAVVLAFFLLPVTQAVTLFDFHAVSFAPLFLWAALYFLDRSLATRGSSLWLWPAANSESVNSEQRIANSEKQTPNSEQRSSFIPHPSSFVFHPSSLILPTLFFLLALSTKEDISLHVFMIGLYVLILRRRWREGSALAVVGLAWFYITFQVIIPHFRTGGEYSIFISWFEPLGRTPLDVALSPFTAPDKVLALLLRPGNVPALAMLTVPLALLPLAGLPWLVLAAPSLAFSLLSDNPTTRQLETWHYAAPMLPFVMLAAVDGLARMRYLVLRFTPGRSFLPARLALPALTLLLLLSSLTYHYWRGYSHLSRLPEWPEITVHHRLGQTLAQSIPADAAVLAQAQLVPHVAQREQVKIWSGPIYPDFDYVWLDLGHPKLPNRFNAHGDLLTGLIIEHTFGPVAAVDGYILLKKGAPRDPLPETLFTFTAFDSLPPGAQPVSAMFGKALHLIAVKPEVRRLATSETEPQLLLYFEVQQTPAEELYLHVYRLDENGHIRGATDYPQPGLYWWPMARWQAGERRQVRVNTLPWWTGDQRLFGYAVGVSRSADPWDEATRLPVLAPDSGGDNPPGLAPLADGTLLPVAAFWRFGGVAYPQPLTVLEAENR